MKAIELSLARDHAGRVFRHKTVSGLRRGRTRTDPVDVTWHEFEGEAGVLLSEENGAWCAARPLNAFGLPAGVCVTQDPPLFDGGFARPVPRVGFSGRRRTVSLESGEGQTILVSVIDGTMRDVSRQWAVCRVVIEGEDEAAARVALALGETLPLSRASASLGEEAMTASRGERPDPPPAAIVGPDATVDEAIRTVIGHLAASLLYWVPAAARGETSLAVHQMRVAVRRLRSAMLVFKEPLGGSLDGLRQPLLALAARLGAARDWDVFLDGTVAELERAMAGEARIASLIADAARSRQAAYDALRRQLASDATRRLLLHLALLPSLAPWRVEGDPLVLGSPVTVLAPRILDRRFKRLVGTADDLASLPASALHDTRKSGKKLRYALEFFAPLLPRRSVRKLARRLSNAQDELGVINDTATGTALLAGLTRGGRHEFASGAVLGWLNAKEAAARAPLEETWTGLRSQGRFWRHLRTAES